MARITYFLALLSAVLALVLLPFLLRSYAVFQLTLVLIYAIALLGLNLLTGFSKQISLGHGAFFAIGAYTTAVLMDRYGFNYLSTLPVAVVVSFAVGMLIGFPALRLGGHNLALATFALAFATPQLLKHQSVESLTGGVQGLVLVKPSSPVDFSLFGESLNSDRRLYYDTLSIDVKVYQLLWNLLSGRIGRA